MEAPRRQHRRSSSPGALATALAARSQTPTTRRSWSRAAQVGRPTPSWVAGPARSTARRSPSPCIRAPDRHRHRRTRHRRRTPGRRSRSPTDPTPAGPSSSPRACTPSGALDEASHLPRRPADLPAARRHHRRPPTPSPSPTWARPTAPTSTTRRSASSPSPPRSGPTVRIGDTLLVLRAGGRRARRRARLAATAPWPSTADPGSCAPPLPVDRPAQPTGRQPHRTRVPWLAMLLPLPVRRGDGGLLRPDDARVRRDEPRPHGGHRRQRPAGGQAQVCRGARGIPASPRRRPGAGSRPPAPRRPARCAGRCPTRADPGDRDDADGPRLGATARRRRRAHRRASAGAAPQPRCASSVRP